MRPLGTVTVSAGVAPVGAALFSKQLRAGFSPLLPESFSASLKEHCIFFFSSFYVLTIRKGGGQEKLLFFCELNATKKCLSTDVHPGFSNVTWRD